MDTARALLDRELIVSGIVHDIRSRLMVVQSYTEMYGERVERLISPATAELANLASALSEKAVGPVRDASFRGIPVRVRGPLDVLEVALEGLPRAAMEVGVQDDHVAIVLTGVPAEASTGGWSYATIQRWLVEGGPALAGARLLIAARVIGATRCSFPVPVGGAPITVILHLAR